MFTDASLSGWGAILFADQHTFIAAGPWDSVALALAARGAGINFLELRTVRLALRRFSLDFFKVLGYQWLQNERIALWIDNTSALFSLVRSRSNSFSLNSELVKVNRLLRRLNLTLLPQYIASQENPADYWSRIFTPSDKIQK
jgi:hypothetical protein